MSASAIGGIGSRSIRRPRSDPAASQTPSTESRSAQAAICCSRRCKAIRRRRRAFASRGKSGPRAEEPPPTNTFAPNRIGATPSYGSPAAPAPPTPASIRSTSRAPSARSVRRRRRLRAIVPQPPETTFTPVPTYNPAAPAPPAPQQIKLPPPEVYPLRAAVRVGATLPPPPPPLRICRSTIRRPRCIRSPPPIVPAAALAAPGPQFYTYAVSSYLPDYVAQPATAEPAAAQYLRARAAAAAPVADPGRARSLRGARHSRRLVHIASLARLFGCGQHQSRTRARRSARRLRRRRAGTDRALGLGASLAHRRHRRLVDAIHCRISCRRSTSRT